MRALPPSLQSWLHESGSLTQRLKQRYGDDFAVNLLLQNWAHGFNEETATLKQHPLRFQLVREVILCANNRPLILARTVIPPATLAFANRQLSRLGTRPLGEVIFAYRDLKIEQRSFASMAFQLSKFEPRNSQTSVHIWGRRSQYCIDGHPLLVAEFFLPELYLNESRINDS